MTNTPDDRTTPWLDVAGAAARILVSKRAIYRAVAAGQLRAARIGGRRQLRFRASWVDTYAESTATPIEVQPR